MPYARRNLKHKGQKVTLKQNNGIKYRKGRSVSNDVKGVWDNKKTLRQNYEQIGLVADSNKLEDAPKIENPLLDFKTEIVEKKKEIVMSVHEQSYILKLVEKYKEDYEAMARDIKINYEQRTARELERLHNNYTEYVKQYEKPDNEDASLLECIIC